MWYEASLLSFFVAEECRMPFIFRILRIFFELKILTFHTQRCWSGKSHPLLPFFKRHLLPFGSYRLASNIRLLSAIYCVILWEEIFPHIRRRVVRFPRTISPFWRFQIGIKHKAVVCHLLLGFVGWIRPHIRRTVIWFPRTILAFWRFNIKHNAPVCSRLRGFIGWGCPHIKKKAVRFPNLRLSYIGKLP